MKRIAWLVLVCGLVLSTPGLATTYYAFSQTMKHGSVTLKSATATVTIANGVLATLYTDAGITPEANPTTTNGSGVLAFYAVAGSYRIVVGDTVFQIKLPVVSPNLAMFANSCTPASGTEIISFDTAGTASCVAGGGGGNSFETITTSSGTSPVADSATDTLTLTGTSPIVVTGNSATDTVTLSLSTPVATATALAANGANCTAGQFPLGVDASGATESCTALPTTITGTANQITASAATGAVTLSIPTNPTLPGTTTAATLLSNAFSSTSSVTAPTSGVAATAQLEVYNGATRKNYFNQNTLSLDSALTLNWSDVGLTRSSAGTLSVDSGSTSNGLGTLQAATLQGSTAANGRLSLVGSTNAGMGEVEAQRLLVGVHGTTTASTQGSLVIPAGASADYRPGIAMFQNQTIPDSITRSGSTATLTMTNNPGFGGATFMGTITGADQPEYNGTFVFTRSSCGAPCVYTYTVVGTPATPATGNILAGKLFFGVEDTNSSAGGASSIVANSPIYQYNNSSISGTVVATGAGTALNTGSTAGGVKWGTWSAAGNFTAATGLTAGTSGIVSVDTTADNNGLGTLKLTKIDGPSNVVYVGTNMHAFDTTYQVIVTGVSGTMGWASGGPPTTGNVDVSIGRSAAGVLELQGAFNGTKATGKLLSSVLNEDSTVGSGSPNVILNTESGTFYYNTGSTAQNYHTLPTAVDGLRYTFTVTDADGIRITAPGSAVIRIGSAVSAAGGHCDSTTIGDSVTLVADGTVNWFAVAIVGGGTAFAPGWTCT